MKPKFIFVLSTLVILTLLLALVGCAGGATSPTPSPSPSPKPTTSAPTTAPPTTSAASPKPSPSPSPSPTATAKPEPLKLKVQSWSGATYAGRLMVEEINKRLEASGYFKIDYFPGEALMKAKESWDGLRQGVLDIAISPAGYHIDRMGIAGETEWMPRNFDFDKFAAHYRDKGGLLDFYQPYFKKQGLRLLSMQSAPPNQLSSRKPVQTLEDVKGMLSRDPGGFAEWLKLLGATPVSVASSEVYEAFQRGTIDMFISHSLSSYNASKWYEVAPNITLIKWALGGMQLVMNDEVYNKLSPEARAVLDKAVLETEPAMFASFKQQDTQFLEDFKKKGVAIYTPPQSEMDRWDAAIKPYMDSLATKYGAEWAAFTKIQATLK